MSSSECEESYAERMERQNDMIVEEDSVVETNCVSSLGTQVELEYVAPKSQPSQVSQVTNSSTPARQQCGPSVEPTLNQPAGYNIFYVQLNYDPNQALDPDSWDGNFHVVSLHRFMEHLASDAKNFKESLSRMKKYILGKSIKNDKDVED